MKTKVLTLILMSIVSAAGADTVAGTLGASFQPWTACDLDEDGKPYWDNVSLDGSHKNIGYALIGNPAVGLPGAPGALPFWGFSYNSASDTGGLEDLNWNFHKDSLQIRAELKLELANNGPTNEFGWYDVANPAALHTVFTGSASGGSIAVFAPSADYGLYLRDGKTGAVYYSQSKLNAFPETLHQHFALFGNCAQQGSYWVGMEDLTLAQLAGHEGVRGDYNDMILRLDCIPESRSSALFMIGMSSLAIVITGRSRPSRSKRAWRVPPQIVSNLPRESHDAGDPFACLNVTNARRP
ncbi:MAG: hypothetical protein JO317_00235 [Verrucomicrobiae bacterium]|nr:hypothetical protein [Verrucomicrobiae bacterium]